VQVLAAAVPLCFEKDRPTELAFYCLMEAAPADHRLEGEREQLYYARLSGTRLEEQQTMFRVAAPLAVQIALADGSRVEESVLQLPLLTPGLERHGVGVKTVGTRHRLYLPLHSASAPKPISVMEVALLRGGELRRAERLILNRLVSAFGAAVARGQHAAAPAGSGHVLLQPRHAAHRCVRRCSCFRFQPACSENSSWVLLLVAARL